MIRYDNTTSAQRIAAYPRAIYRVTIERNPLASLSFATGTLRWRSVVNDVLNNSQNVGTFALGGAEAAVLDTDKVATLDFQAKATAPQSATVADLINAVNGASRYARVVSVSREAPLPGFNAGGPDQLAAEREARNAAEREQQRERSPLSAIGGALSTTRTVVIAAVIVAAAVASYRLFPSAARTAK